MPHATPTWRHSSGSVNGRVQVVADTQENVMIATSQVERIPSNHEVSRTNPFIHTFSEKKLSKRDRVRARNRTFAGMTWPSGLSVSIMFGRNRIVVRPTKSLAYPVPEQLGGRHRYFADGTGP